MTSSSVAIIGAGPYGLATGAHLRASGFNVRIFGDPMGFWRQMPVGMILRSEWEGSSISDPSDDCSLNHYEKVHGFNLSRRLPLEDFIAYGEWFQSRACPDVENRRVQKVSTKRSGFNLEMADGEHIFANRVVVATGLESYQVLPRLFQSTELNLAVHSSRVHDIASHRGKSVVIVGAGQSGLELAALLSEAGAFVELVVRASEVRWLSSRGWVRKYAGPFRKIISPPARVGPTSTAWLAEFPDIFRKLPIATQKKIAQRAFNPAGSAWLRPRVTNVSFTVNRTITGASPCDGKVRLTLNDQTERLVDKVILATGYKVNVPKHPVLTPELADAIRCIDGSPILAPGCESSISGLHFVGAVAVESFGPLMKFVAGTKYSATAVARSMRRSLVQ